MHRPAVNAATTAARRYADVLRRRYGDRVLEVRLFGSFARGDADEDSDVDVAVVMTELDWSTHRDVIDLASDTGLEHGVLLSPSAFDRATYERWRGQERPLVIDIEREGIAL